MTLEQLVNDICVAPYQNNADVVREKIFAFLQSLKKDMEAEKKNKSTGYAHSPANRRVAARNSAIDQMVALVKKRMGV